MKKSFRWGNTILAIAIGMTTWQFSQGKEVYVQSWLAHSLLHTAWVRTQASGHQVKPWPWANTWPLARLYVPRLNLDQIILSRANEGMSAFALGHSDSSVQPGELGNSVLNAVHHNTYFSFLKSLKLGDMLVLESFRSGRWHYQISAIYIVDKTDTYWVEPSLNRRLTLVSCYPCTGKNNRRYVVIAEEVERMT
ncbi:class D sortase [Candidatus Parabeggiatoa sp. HSG14]|uniref:class D sortase n=1 Tax=Candidatus Parabeggiatoa sp. HSG14 TaxID=3055593 RepID=UPI0025A747D7|nr:class D sortase [Thiotrichales bacterium HSG14]